MVVVQSEANGETGGRLKAACAAYTRYTKRQYMSACSKTWCSRTFLHSIWEGVHLIKYCQYSKIHLSNECQCESWQSCSYQQILNYNKNWVAFRSWLVFRTVWGFDLRKLSIVCHHQIWNYRLVYCQSCITRFNQSLFHFSCLIKL